MTPECQTIQLGTEHGTRLSKDEVIKIAKEKAIQEGFDLAKYDRKGCYYEYIEEDHYTWTVFFDGKPPRAVGDHFLILINDHTKEATFIPGE